MGSCNRSERGVACVRSTDGTSIYYEVEGDGPTVLLHHAFMGSSLAWRESGKPSDPGDYLIARRVEDVIAVLDAEALLASTIATRDEADLELDLNSLDMPSMLWCGTADPGFEGARRCAGEIPNAELVALHDLDHFQGFRDSGAVLPRLSGFLAEAIQ